MGHIDGGLVLQVRLLADPCLWYWEISDGDGRLVESSWANEWVAFASGTEAAAAGGRRLAELATVGSAARVSPLSRRLTQRIVAEHTRRAG